MEGWVLVYTAPHSFEAHFIRSLLESRAIEVRIMNDGITPMGIKFPLGDSLVEVWVPEASEVEAREVLAEIEKSADSKGRLSEPDEDIGGLEEPET